MTAVTAMLLLDLFLLCVYEIEYLLGRLLLALTTSPVLILFDHDFRTAVCCVVLSVKDLIFLLVTCPGILYLLLIQLVLLLQLDIMSLELCWIIFLPFFYRLLSRLRTNNVLVVLR